MKAKIKHKTNNPCLQTRLSGLWVHCLHLTSTVPWGMASLDPALTNGDGSLVALAPQHLSLGREWFPFREPARSRALHRAQRSGEQRLSSSENTANWGGSYQEQISTQPRKIPQHQKELSRASRGASGHRECPLRREGKERLVVHPKGHCRRFWLRCGLDQRMIKVLFGLEVIT